MEAIDSDLYGFESLADKKRPSPPEDDNPIQAFGVHNLMTHLMRKKLGSKHAEQKFDDEVHWGSGTGSWRIQLTPNASIIVSQMNNDLQGNAVWLCKRVYRINEADFTGKEDVIAKDLFEKVEELAKKTLPKIDRNFNELFNLVKFVSKNLQNKIPGLFMYEDVKKVNDKEYIIYYSLRGGGRGKLTRVRQRGGYMPFLDIYITHSDETGLIRVILTSTTIDDDGGNWDLDIPFGDFYFSPDKEEILAAIVTSLRFF